MPILVCVNATERSPYVDLNIDNGRSALDLLYSRIQALPDTAGVVALVSPEDRRDLPGGWQRLVLEDKAGNGERALLEALSRALEVHPEVDLLLYCAVDAPFLDGDLCSRMTEQHRRYAAEYSFADGYPGGLAPELLAPSVLPRLLQLVSDCASGLQPARDALFQIIQRDINSFDIETTLSDHDLRMLRIELYCNNRRNWVLCKRLLERGAGGAAAIVDAVRSDQRVLRTLPAYAVLDVVEGSTQDVAYSPYRLFGPAGRGKQREMAVADVGRLVKDLERFSPGCVVSYGLWGEPGLHSDPVSLITSSRPCPLVIETSAVGWNHSMLERAIDSDPQRVTWIVHLDAVDEEVYRSVRGDGFAEAMRVTELLLQRVPERVYVQTVRYRDVEQHTEPFYRYWKERTDNVIVQKYDHFCGVLEDKRISDISPVTRFACWHLRRDLTVLVDGSVPMCREDIYAKHVAGNVLNSGVEAVWGALEPYHDQHVKGDYPSLCRNCDEYYTFNF